MKNNSAISFPILLLCDKESLDGSNYLSFPTYLDTLVFSNCGTYLIFVIFFTQARFLENKIYTEERVNYDKWILRQNSVNRDLLGQANYKDQDYTKFVTHCV